MTFKTFEQLPESEKEDFVSSCAKRKLSASDFLVSVEEQYPTEGIGHIRRMVHVRRGKATEGKSYPAGSGSAWNFAFESDLLAGAYD